MDKVIKYTFLRRRLGKAFYKVNGQNQIFNANAYDRKFGNLLDSSHHKPNFWFNKIYSILHEMHFVWFVCIVWIASSSCRYYSKLICDQLPEAQLYITKSAKLCQPTRNLTTYSWRNKLVYINYFVIIIKIRISVSCERARVCVFVRRKSRK